MLVVVLVQSLSHVWLFATPWTAAQEASLSFTISWSLFKLMFIESVMPSNHLIVCCPLLFLPSIFHSIRVFSKELALHLRWPKYWSFPISICPSNEYSGLISFRIDLVWDKHYKTPRGKHRQNSLWHKLQHYLFQSISQDNGNRNKNKQMGPA